MEVGFLVEFGVMVEGVMQRGEYKQVATRLFSHNLPRPYCATLLLRVLRACGVVWHPKYTINKLHRTYLCPLARKPECSRGGVPGLVPTQPEVSDLSHWFFCYLEVVMR